MLAHWETQALRTELDDRAAAKARLLDASVRQSMHVLYSISSLVATHPPTTGGAGASVMSRSAFRVFVAQALARQPELQAIGWTPRVAHRDRERFEQAARDDGLAGFEFRQHDDAGRPVRVPDRAEYFPVYYLEPQADNAPALGFELDSDPVRMAALHEAARTGLPTATSPVPLVQKPHDGVGFVVYLPVYDAATSRPDPARLVGYASAVFRIEPLIARVEAGLADEGLTLAVTDESAGGRSLYGDAARGDFTGVAPLPLAGRQWSLALRPTPAFIARHRHSESVVVLGSGVVIALLLSAYVRGGVRQRAIIEQRVDERTRQLQHAEAKARGIFQHAVEGMFQTTVDGRYLSANPALASIYGYASADELMRELADVGDQLYVDRSRRKEFVRLVQDGGVVKDFQSQVRRRDGRVIWIAENARVVRDEQGGVQYFEGSVVDITDRKHAEQLLRDDREALEVRVRQRTAELDRAIEALQGEVAERTRAQATAAAASQAKSRFLANISHEIRTPMNAILGYAQLLGGDANLTSGQREAMGTILSSGRHLLGLIDDVLDLSKIEAGRTELHPAAFSLPDALREVASLFAGRCIEKGLLLRVDATGGEGWPACVWGDSRKLRQVLINLLGNAVKFTDEGGVTLRVARLGETRYRFEVVDTGIGIQPDALPTIFEPFQQATSGAVRGGTGLGLAIARGQIEAMGGRLGVQSTPSVGSRFDFEIDLPATAVEADLPQRLGRVLSPGRVLRVLVVDDVPESRSVVGQMLRRIGCRVAEASSVAAAVEQARQFEADIAIVDLIMPGVDGLAGAKALAAALGPAAKLLAMSASATPETRARCEQAGFHDFLPKPIELDRLAMAVARAAGVGLESAPVEPSLDIATASLDELLPSLRRRIVRAARRCSVTDLKNCLAEAEVAGPPGAAALLRRSLRSYDMDLLVRALDEPTAEDR